MTSRIDFTSMPTVCSALIADSRPDPGPFTRTSTDRRPLASRAWLWDAVAPLPTVADRLEAHSRVWAVESGSDSTDVTELRSLGYTVERAIPVHRTVVYELVKEGS